MLQMANMIKNAEDIKCECGSLIFNQANKLKRVSRILTGEAEDLIIPVPAILCAKCHTELILDKEPPKEDLITLDFRNKK